MFVSFETTNVGLIHFDGLAFASYGIGKMTIAIASRKRCSMNQRVLYWTFSVRCSWWALIPFLLLAIKWAAWNHRCSLTWLRSKTVPTVTVN